MQTTGPVNHQDDLIGCLVLIDHNLFDQRTHDLFLQNHTGIRMMPDPTERLSQVSELLLLLRRRRTLLPSVEEGKLLLNCLDTEQCLFPFLCQSLTNGRVGGIRLFVFAGSARFDFASGFKPIHNNASVLFVNCGQPFGSVRRSGYAGRFHDFHDQFAQLLLDVRSAKTETCFT